jgi:hypothetical protein
VLEPPPSIAEIKRKVPRLALTAHAACSSNQRAELGMTRCFLVSNCHL